MNRESFLALYANTPLHLRGIAIDFNKYGPLTLDSIYYEIQALEEFHRPIRIKEMKLIATGYEGLKNLKQL